MIFEDFIPWGHVLSVLGVHAGTARRYVKMLKVKKIPNPYSPHYFLYDRKDVFRVKEYLKIRATAIRNSQGKFVRWERKEA